MYKSYVFCLEVLSENSTNQSTNLLLFLEQLAQHFNIDNVYQTCEDIEGFENSLQILLYEDRHFKDYNILYFNVKGSENQIDIDNYFYSFEEIAELFEGKLSNKIIHFTNTFLLNITPDEAQYFLDVTGARGISGYSKKAPVLSTVLDGFYFNLCQTITDPIELVETLYDEKYALCKTLGFTFYY